MDRWGFPRVCLQEVYKNLLREFIMCANYLAKGSQNTPPVDRMSGQAGRPHLFALADYGAQCLATPLLYTHAA